MPLAVLSLAAVSLTLAAQAPQPTPRPERFDLKCAGHDELTSYVAVEGSSTPTPAPLVRPWTSTYHVDLARNLWCQDKCHKAYAYAPALAKPDLVVLVETDAAGARRRTVFEAKDGTLLSLEAAGQSLTPVRARCTLAPPSGDPGKAVLRGAPLDPRARPYPAD